MSILVTGANGTIGSLVVQGLARQGAEVQALVRSAGRTALPPGVAEVVADLTDVPSMRRALSGVRTPFLLNAVTPDEVTQALLALSLAAERPAGAAGHRGLGPVSHAHRLGGRGDGRHA